MKTKLIIWIAVAMLGMTSASFAVTYYPPITGFQDDDLEWFEDSDAIGTAGYGLISEGDRLYGVLEMMQTFSVETSGMEAVIGPNQELTGVFDMVVAGVNGSTITFVPNSASSILDPNAPEGTIISLYLDNSPDLNAVAVNCANFGACAALASDGNLYMNLGFGGDADEGWFATTIGGALNPTTVADGAANATFGFYNYFLSVLTNNTGLIIGEQSCAPLCQGGDSMIQVLGSGNILGGQGLSNGAFARSDIDAQIPTAVPEPSTLVLLGAGLLGLGAMARRRMN